MTSTDLNTNTYISEPSGYVERSNISIDRDKIDSMYEGYELESKLSQLRSDIGENLFNRLSVEDRVFMARTAGSVDFGYKVDLDGVASSIKNYDPSEK